MELKLMTFKLNVSSNLEKKNLYNDPEDKVHANKFEIP